MPEAAIAVVVPFYQKQPGILRRAVESALTQTDVAVPRVIVVDDGSPIDAREELADLCRAFAGHLEILKQENAGPGAARNTALRHLLGRAELIAFLDSDDVWEPHHLSTAQAALNLGFDFYFCDAFHRNSDHTLFDTKEFPDLDCHALLPVPPIYEYRGDFFQLILEKCPMQISATVYRSSSVATMFREELRTAGEDYSFWLEIAYSGRKIAFSTSRNVKLGTGVNIYASVEWATNDRLTQIYYNQRYMSRLPRQFALTSAQRDVCLRLTSSQRQLFVENVCSMIVHRKRLEPRIVLHYIKLDPLVLLVGFPSYVARRLAALVMRSRAVRSSVRKGDS